MGNKWVISAAYSAYLHIYVIYIYITRIRHKACSQHVYLSPEYLHSVHALLYDVLRRSYKRSVLVEDVHASVSYELLYIIYTYYNVQCVCVQCIYAYNTYDRGN